MKTNALGLKIKADIVQADGIDGFACYLANSVRKNRRCIIGLNIEAFMSAVACKDLRRQDIPYVMAETIMHEVIHALEDWAKVEFSHRKVNKLIEAYRKHYLKEVSNDNQDEKTGHTGRKKKSVR